MEPEETDNRIGIVTHHGRNRMERSDVHRYSDTNYHYSYGICVDQHGKHQGRYKFSDRQFDEPSTDRLRRGEAEAGLFVEFDIDGTKYTGQVWPVVDPYGPDERDDD